MKGIKVSLDTKVNANLCNWRVFPYYDVKKDCLSSNMQTWRVDNFIDTASIPKDTYVTISLESSAITQIYLLGATDVIAHSKGKDYVRAGDNGQVRYPAANNEQLRWVTYKITDNTKSGFTIIMHNYGIVRNVKVELSDHPTDYIDYQGGVTRKALVIMLSSSCRKEVAA